MVDENRVVRIFENLTRIYSPSYKERTLADHIKGYVEALGYLAFEDEAGSAVGSNAGNIIVTIPGNTAGPSIMFASHMDTVEPAKGVEPAIADGVIRSSGNTILGGDDKAGIAAMLELISVLAGKSVPHGPVHLVFTIAEEVGLEGAKNLDLSDKHIDFAYVLDSNGKVGNIVVSAPYQDSFIAEFKGRAAHAGLAPEDGINAITAAAKAIGYMKLGRIDEETTANVGVIEGGRAANIVAESAKVIAEARSIDVKKLEKQSEEMIACFERGAKETGAKVSIKRYRPYEGYSLTESDEVVKRVIGALNRLGISYNLIKSGGGSDTNIFNAMGINAVNLGIGVEFVHTTDEYIPIAELRNLAMLLVELVKV